MLTASSSGKLDELIFELKKKPNYEGILVKSDLDAKWQPLYSVQAITEKLGISRRTQLRVPIFGFFEGQNISSAENFSSKLLTISEGGFGVTDAFGLKIGQNVKGQIVSPNVSQALSIIGEIVYAGDHGELGIKFSSLSKESQNLVLQYISKFKESEL